VHSFTLNPDAVVTPAAEANEPAECKGPGVRFCHVGVVYDSSFYIFGGYDGNHR
jgi:hypothetical protein